MAQNMVISVPCSTVDEIASQSSLSETASPDGVEWSSDRVDLAIPLSDDDDFWSLNTKDNRD
jgi:hypothetical protein